MKQDSCIVISFHLKRTSSGFDCSKTIFVTHENFSKINEIVHKARSYIITLNEWSFIDDVNFIFSKLLENKLRKILLENNDDILYSDFIVAYYVLNSSDIQDNIFLGPEIVSALSSLKLNICFSVIDYSDALMFALDQFEQIKNKGIELGYNIDIDRSLLMSLPSFLKFKID